MATNSIRKNRHFADDAFRAGFAATIAELTVWSDNVRDVADIAITDHSAFWRLAATPKMPGACAFELVLKRDQTFSLAIGPEVYEDKEIDDLGLFPLMAKAIEAGDVERVETVSALTDELLSIAMRVDLADDTTWLDERAVGDRGSDWIEPALERRAHRFLPYRR